MNTYWGKDKRWKNAKDWEDQAKFIEKIIKKLDKNYKKYNVLEIGCGNGALTFPISKIFKNTDAIDITIELIEILDKRIRNNNNKNIKTILTHCKDFKFKKKYNLIIAMNTFVWTNQKKCLKNIINHLKKNGYLLLIEPIWPFELFQERLKQNYFNSENQQYRNNLFKTFELISKQKNLEKIYFDKIMKSNWILCKLK